MYNPRSLDILARRKDSFVLWMPNSPSTLAGDPPVLVLRKVTNRTLPPFDQIQRFSLAQSQDCIDLWELRANSILPPLVESVYHYWFEVEDSSPERGGKMIVTDPLAFTVDYQDCIGAISGERSQPAAVIKYCNGQLYSCDIDGIEPKRPSISNQANFPSNNHLVTYELPTSWAKGGLDLHGVEVDIGTFADVRALFDIESPGDHFSSVSAVSNEAILSSLGVNALELLPVADAKPVDEWGYATAHYFATDYDLGSASTLVLLIQCLHEQNIRFFADVVMAFGHDPYRYISFDQFHLRPSQEPENPDSYQSHSMGNFRDGWGGESWRYICTTETYDPESGRRGLVHPSWSFHHAHLVRWMTDFGVGGLRLDSINNIANWDFIRWYKNRAWELFRTSSHDSSKFLVIGEELTMPVAMIRSTTVDALWNEPWQGRLRAALLGESTGGDTFEWTIRKLANCTLDQMDEGSFTDGSQAVNYITSHDIAGYRKERLYDFLVENGVWDVGKRAKLAFVLLLTSVGIPMIFAGEEFADRMDVSLDINKKQTDPVNYERKNDDGWRQSLFTYVSSLVKFRQACPALGENDTDFFHVDQTRGGRIMAWRRGAVGEGKFPVVVVANFSDEDTPGNEYVVPNWPEENLRGWKEITQGRIIPPEWVGREPLYAWEAKVYTRWQQDEESLIQ